MLNIFPSLPDFCTYDLQGNEYPSGFSYEEAVRRVHDSGLLNVLIAHFGPERNDSSSSAQWGCAVEQWPSIQDAYFHTEIVLKHLHPLFPEDRYSLKLSNFGNLAQISAIDTNELPQEAIDLLSQICTSSGYILLPDELLYAKWENAKGVFTTAAKRFFSYV